MNTKKSIIMRMSVKLLVCVVAVLLCSFDLPTAFSEELVPCGRTVGIMVLTKGVLVVGNAEFENKSGKTISPAEEAGIMPGDTLLSINGKDITSSNSLAELTNEFGGSELNVRYLRNGEEKTVTINAEASSDGKYRLGVWIKDSENGIGTLTYIDPETKKFGALGHGICDMKGGISDISGGSISEAQITSVKRGERGAPGELMGIFTEDSEVLGVIKSNTEKGVFGEVSDAGSGTNEYLYDKVETARRDEAFEGDATILSDIGGDGVCEYAAQITKINSDTTNTKGLIIKITDSRLIERTGGIVQGMSGSPIIQNGKLVGAVTHVFVNDPTRGYGIFIENMLSEADKTNND